MTGAGQPLPQARMAWAVIVAIRKTAKSPARFDPDEDEVGSVGAAMPAGAQIATTKALIPRRTRLSAILLHKEPEDMATAELEQILSALHRRPN